MDSEAARWCAAYRRGISEIDDESGLWPAVRVDVALALVNLAAHVRTLTRGETTPFEMAMRRLTFATDDLLAMLFVPADDDADADVVRVWRDARREFDELACG
ncbi:hypothetical protein [Mycobacterium sp.]|uniref:hypothetical protein n=1 Tax=Mycobacterium sp. TaxID=1785 RepID=UPI0031E0C551